MLVKSAPYETQFLAAPAGPAYGFDNSRVAAQQVLAGLREPDAGGAPTLPDQITQHPIYRQPPRRADGSLEADNLPSATEALWMSGEVIAGRVESLQRTWDEFGVEPGLGPELEKHLSEKGPSRHRDPGRHRREKPRLAIRIARGLGVVAAGSALFYAGIEWFTN